MNNNKLDAKLVELHSLAHDLIAKLQEKVDATPASTEDGADWGHAGDLAHICEQLKNALGIEG